MTRKDELANSPAKEEVKAPTAAPQRQETNGLIQAGSKLETSALPKIIPGTNGVCR